MSTSTRPYEIDRRFGDHWLRLAQQTLAPYCIPVAPDEIDQKQAADFITADRRIAFRVRRAGFIDSYRYEFTIRSHRTNGVETELPKILKGYGDWMLYAHCDEQNGEFALWWLVDLHAFRMAIGGDHPIKFIEKPNHDLTTRFRAYDLRSFPAHLPIIVASSEPLNQVEPQNAIIDLDSLRWQGTLAAEQPMPDGPMTDSELKYAFAHDLITYEEFSRRLHELEGRS